MSRSSSTLTGHRYYTVAHVRSRDDASTLSDGAKGAYGKVVGAADDAESFLQNVRSMLERDGLTVIEFQLTQELEQVAEAGDFDSELYQLACALSTSQPIQYRTFYNYFGDDA